MKALRVVLLVTLFITGILPNVARSEMYRGIGPYDTLGDVQKMLPNATFKKRNPAWAKEKDVMFSITGPGISGTIIIKFDDNRQYWRTRVQEVETDELKYWFQQLAEAPDDSVTVSWVRWVPDAPFPLERLTTKYGKPDISGFSDEDYEPYKHWTGKGLQAFLTDDGKKVTRIDFAFTEKDAKQAFKTKFGRSYPDTETPKEKKQKKK